MRFLLKVCGGGMKLTEMKRSLLSYVCNAFGKQNNEERRALLARPRQNLASGKWSATGVGNFPGVGRVNELLKIRVLHVFAKARPLLLYFGAAHGGGSGSGGDGAGTWAQLQWVAGHGGTCYLSFIPKKQHQCNADTC
ncbi:unnamed protein product [Fraxinus pennsylvanica]|uniref:Uncharacterized protein n=1 Tax=Fraxinus pennsylvanica TaxID=56036 RepID=A0AAD1Z382_9LAMI|nr:unnamed protein product [Fraxinus pennsylvanica]